MTSHPNRSKITVLATLEDDFTSCWLSDHDGNRIGRLEVPVGYVAQDGMPVIHRADRRKFIEIVATHLGLPYRKGELSLLSDGAWCLTFFGDREQVVHLPDGLAQYFIRPVA